MREIGHAQDNSGSDPSIAHKVELRCPQQLVGVLPDRFLRRPSIQLLSPPVPVRYDVARVADKNRVLGKIEQAGLLRSHRNFLLEFVAGFEKLSLDAAADGAEPGEKNRKRYEEDIVREFRSRDVKHEEVSSAIREQSPRYHRETSCRRWRLTTC